jgi:hypothetical protein
MSHAVSPTKDMKEVESKSKPKKVYDYQDLIAFQSSEVYSSIGKMRLSSKSSAPCYGFGTADRAKQAKVFTSKELCKTQFLGKTSAGPNYEVRHTDKYYYNEDPKWSFGQDKRNTLNTGQKHAHYNRMDVDFDPITADNSRKWGSAKVKIGLESRFGGEVKPNKVTPGPEYNPGVRPEIPIQPKYSFGVRREIQGQSPLAPAISTPAVVGPGRYLQKDAPKTSVHGELPKWGFTKAEKFMDFTDMPQKNQTYDTRSAIGFQIASKKTTEPKISIGKARRDASTGIFKDHMATQPTRIRIDHPKF